MTPHRWSWRTFWASLAVLSALLGTWGLATPLFAVPDEPAHFLRAAGVVRGQLGGLPGQPTAVRVPPALESTRLQTGCFVFQPAVPADCAPGYDGGDGPDRVAFTQAGRYPPVWYAAVGWPTLLRPTDLDVLRAVRGVSAALCAALLAAALTTLAGTGRRWPVLALGVAVTPMAVFLGSSVNPSGLEVAGAVALWSAGLVLATGTGPAPRPVLATAGLAAVAVCLSRPISPFWVALVGLALLVVAGRRRVAELGRSGAVRAWTGAVVVAAGAQAAWVLLAGSLELYGGGQPVPLRERLVGSLARADQRLQQQVGWFGWLDTPAPTAVHVLWGLALAVVVLAGLRGAGRRRRLLVPALALAVLAVPVALEVPSVPDVGYYWQGRYVLPLTVGLPLLAAVVTRRRGPGRWGVPLVALLAVCHVVSFVVALGRYTVGTGNGLGLVDVAWEPPLPAPVLAVAVTLAAAGWAVLLLLAGRRPGGATLPP